VVASRVIAKNDAARGVKVWDLPTRLFHCALLVSVLGAVTTARLAGNWMEWHLRFGIATVALLGFRVVWGWGGPRYARFRSFLYSPQAAWRHLFESSSRYPGHSPSGAMSVYALLATLVGEAVSGLFSSDAISTDGPLARWIGEAGVGRATWAHLRLQWVLYALIAMHVAAVLAYLLVKKDNLVTPMVSGRKSGIEAEPAADGWAVRLAGALLLLVCFAAAFWGLS
jgi:cytochrome b